MCTKKKRSLVPWDTARANLALPGLEFLGQDISDVSQFVAAESENEFMPEKYLMLAVLKDAIRAFQQGYASQRVAQRREALVAEEWITCLRDNSPFSFEIICLSLGINPDYLRDGLMQWKRLVTSSQTPRAHVAKGLRRAPAGMRIKQIA